MKDNCLEESNLDNQLDNLSWAIVIVSIIKALSMQSNKDFSKLKILLTGEDPVKIQINKLLLDFNNHNIDITSIESNKELLKHILDIDVLIDTSYDINISEEIIQKMSTFPIVIITKNQNIDLTLLKRLKSCRNDVKICSKPVEHFFIPLISTIYSSLVNIAVINNYAIDNELKIELVNKLTESISAEHGLNTTLNKLIAENYI